MNNITSNWQDVPHNAIHLELLKVIKSLSEKENLSDQDDKWNRLQARRYLSHQPVPKPEPVITICGPDQKEHIISTAGNLTVFSGYRKVGKSAVFQGLIAGTMKLPGDFPPDSLGFTIIANSKEKAVIHIDTEQSDFDGWRFANNAEKRASRNHTPDWFYSYNLRPYSPKERFELLELIFNKCAQKHDGIHCTIIDGIGDLTDDPNDPTDSNEAVSRLEKLAVQYSCPIITALHLNPGSTKMRGHLGSQLERKAESIFVLVKDKERNITQIQEDALRNAGSVPILEFGWDDQKGYHVFKGIQNQSLVRTKKRTSPTMYSKEEHQETLNKIFRSSKEMMYNQLVQAIMETYLIGQTNAKTFIPHLIELELINKHQESTSTIYEQTSKV